MTVFSITANCDQIMTVTLKKYKENKYEISEDKKCIEYCENLKKQNIEDSQSDKSEENL